MRIAINIIIIAAIFGALMYAVYYAAHKRQPTGAQLGSPEQLHRLADQIRAPASAHRIAPYRVNAAAGGAVGSEYETNQDQNVIYAYYAAVLTDRGRLLADGGLIPRLRLLPQVEADPPHQARSVV